MVDGKQTETFINNSHIESYIDYYLSLNEAPNHAIFLDGEWGIGKTFLVKSLLKSKFKNRKDEYVYISLYGLKSTEDIDKALLSSLHPLIYNKRVKTIGKLIKAGLNSVGLKAELDFKLEDALSKFNADLYVFDDLERCEIPIKEIFGYINEFVEHDGCKVILIANLKEIGDKDTFTRQQEKIVGKKFVVQSELDNALSNFINKIQDKSTKDLYKKSIKEIKKIYEQSSLNNLRILQQILWDFERLYKCITPQFKNNESAINQITQLFFALSFELKAGRIEAKDLYDRLNLIVSGISNKKMSGHSTTIIEANDRYSDIELYDTVLSDEILADMLIKGIYDQTKINECLAKSEYFVDKSSEPLWRKLWRAYELSDKDFIESISQFRTNFSARTFTKIGEILQIFGIKLWLTRLGAIESNLRNAEKECKEYIDDLFNRKILEPMPLNSWDEGIQFSGYEGLGIHESSSLQFQRVFKHLQKRRVELREMSYPHLGIELLNEMKSDSLLFHRRINATNSDENTYAQVPILSYLDPDSFVNSLLEIDARSQIRVVNALNKRHTYLISPELESEKDWIKKVHEILKSHSRNMSPLMKERLIKPIEGILKRING